MKFLLMLAVLVNVSCVHDSRSAVKSKEPTWTDEDAKNAGTQAVNSLLSSICFTSHAKKRAGEPFTVVFGTFEDRTHDGANLSTLQATLKAELVKAKKVTVGTSKNARYVLQGQVDSAAHAMGGTSVRSFYTTTTLTDIKSSETCWAHKHEIKKKFGK